MGYAYLLAFLFSGAAVVLYYTRRGLPRDGPQYPPGPKPDPVIGNLRQLPQRNAWLTFAKWAKTYGDVISVVNLGQRVVILNSPKAASEFFEKRGSIYSDRPPNVMIHELMDLGTNVIFLSYNDSFRSQRKLMHAALNPTAVADYVHIQEREAYALLYRLLEDPERYRHHVRRTAGSIILTFAYGHTVKSDDDYYVKLAEAAGSALRPALQPASFLVNLIPALKYVPAWFPLASFQRHAHKGRKLIDDLRNEPFEMVKAQMNEGTAPRSYISSLLEAKGTITGQEDEEHQIRASAAALYIAGSDTSTSVVVTFILAMVLYPEVQRKAQAELDSVLGQQSRLPRIADKALLPYLNYVMMEVLRWQPVTSVGVPHAASEDAVFDGHFIPKGTTIVGNIWAMTHDEEMYEDPERFWPERFDGRFPATKDPRAFVFGFGRRLCPGRHLALNSFFITVAGLLATFNFSRVRDANGNEVDPVVDYSGGPPAPFKCLITPRSEEAVSLVRAAHTAAEL